MLVLRKGANVPFPDKLVEGYEIGKDRILANVSADKIEMVMAHFICLHEEPLFFILELPAKQDNEVEVRPGIVEAFHKDVYYIDGCNQEEALVILSQSGQLMIDDGMCSFGFGCHNSQDEIMFGKYNVTTVFSQDIEQYREFFQEHEIPAVEHLLTAPDTFSNDHPGVSESIESDGKSVYSIIDDFVDWGIYKAETREE